MIGMVVCTILTAGFLASQGTSLGIARNERDAQKCRVMAQTGVDMCYWLIRNRSDWRQSMTTGKWLNKFPVGDGTVTVTVDDLDGSGNFLDDPTQGVLMTSTGTYDNRDFALTATIKPTGGGTVFYGGSFIAEKIVLGNSDGLTIAQLDSYNSSVAAYNLLTSSANAAFTSLSTDNNTLTVYSPSMFRGSFTANPNVATPSSTVTLVGAAAIGPASISSAVEARNPGTVILPNTAGLSYRGAGFNPAAPSPGRYDAFTVSGTTITINNSGLYYITGNLSIATSVSSISIPDGKEAVFLVNGNATFKGRVTVAGTGKATFYCNGNVQIENTLLNSAGPPSRLLIFGTDNCGTVNIIGTTSVYGALFAPEANVTLQTGSPKFFGAIIAKNLTIKNTAQFHFDEALRSLKLSNITDGSAPPGTPEYRVTVKSGPGLVR
jgi:hypothetical protein